MTDEFSGPDRDHVSGARAGGGWAIVATSSGSGSRGSCLSRSGHLTMRPIPLWRNLRNTLNGPGRGHPMWSGHQAPMVLGALTAGGMALARRYDEATRAANSAGTRPQLQTQAAIPGHGSVDKDEGPRAVPIPGTLRHRGGQGMPAPMSIEQSDDVDIGYWVAGRGLDRQVRACRRQGDPLHDRRRSLAADLLSRRAGALAGEPTPGRASAP
jgi:hypothetical protein